ncbi:MAG: ATP-binding protein [Halobacteriovoraceae bacterium]|nr:ATP-binding protein [Halobacteriovoraceae bacterium]
MVDSAVQLLELKERLNKELQKENSDNNLILSLSHQIAKLDEQEVRFSVDAGIINRLGKELVGRHETAVSELVKNAYDADALEVKLTFENAWNKGGTLYIEDDGAGMNRKQLIDGFMRLSSSDKIHNPVSPRYKRIRAGKKGIGRFATQRLGKNLTIITQTLESGYALKIEIKWKDFETDKDLLLITNQITPLPKTKEEGTTLIIDDLRDAWSDAMIKRAYRYTSDLLQPFPLSKKRKKEEERRTDPGFRSSYFRKDGNGLHTIADEEEAFFKHALAEIEGYILKDGQGCWGLKSDKLNFQEEVFLIGKERNEVQSRFEYIRNVHFKCYYFIYDSKLLPSKTLSFIRTVANESGGIRLYRNGFRVLPYGETGNDWLGLDASVRKRQILAPHSNNSFFGFVEVSDLKGDIFNETSSREGLIENQAFHELADFIYRSIVSAVLKIAEVRSRKKKTSQKDWEKKDKKKPEEEVDSAIDDLEKIVNKSSVDESGEFESDEKDKGDSKGIGLDPEELKSALGRLKEGREKEKEEKQQLIEEVNMLRVLAGLGLVIGEFVHEVQRFLPAFDTDIKYLRKIVKELEEALKRVDRLDDNLKGFTTYTSYFYKSISRNVLRELEPIELRDIVYDFEKVIQNDIERCGFGFHKPVFEDYDLWTVPMHKSEWASILFNFYINSKKAIRRAGTKGEILIRSGKENGIVFLEFSDNGDGIPPENEEKIFDAFFTTTSAAGHSSSDEEALTGIGLGLKIVQDIVESYGGEIFVTSPHEDFSTTIRVEIPQNTEIEENE